MWKKLKESASGITPEFFSNIFRRRNYEQFDSEERYVGVGKSHSSTDTFSDYRDAENNKVMWKSDSSYQHLDSADDGFTALTLHPYGEETESLRRRTNKGVNMESRIELSPDGVYNSDYVKDVPTQGLCSHGFADDMTKISSPREDISDMFYGHMQRRYERLDDSEEEILNDEDVAMGSESNVFRSIKDFDSKLGKSSKARRRKKLGKRARRSIRRSWKWVKRGFLGYAYSLPNMNIFFVVHTRK